MESLQNIISIFSGSVEEPIISVVLFKLFMTLSLAIGAISCFFGYKLQRLYAAFLTAIVFGGAIGGLCVLTQAIDGILLTIVIFLFLVLGGFLGFKFFKISIVIASGVVVGGAVGGVIYIISRAEVLAIIVFLLIAALVGIIINLLFKPVIIITTTFNGAVATVSALISLVTCGGFIEYFGGYLKNWIFSLIGKSTESIMSNPLSIILITFVFVLGVIVQWKTADKPLSQFKEALQAEKSMSDIENMTDDDKKVYYAMQKVLKATDYISNNDYTKIIAQKVTLPKIENLEGCMIFSAIFAFIAFTQYSSLEMFLICFSIIGVGILPVLSENDKKIPDLFINIMFIIGTITTLVIVIKLLLDGASLITYALYISILLMFIALWIAFIKMEVKEAVFIIAFVLSTVGLFLVTVMYQGFDYLSMAVITITAPFSLPVLKRFYGSFKEKKIHINDAENLKESIEKEPVAVGVLTKEPVAENKEQELAGELQEEEMQEPVVEPQEEEMQEIEVEPQVDYIK